MHDLTINCAQMTQPWTVPYSPNLMECLERMEHLMGSHCVLHVAKSVGKLAAVFEEADHTGSVSPSGLRTIKDMSADLMVIAMRLANLYKFNLSDELVRRVQEKNKVEWPCPR